MTVVSGDSRRPQFLTSAHWFRLPSKAPVVVARRSHIGEAARAHGEQVGVAEALRIIEDRDDLRIGAHDRRVPRFGAFEPLQFGMTIEEKFGGTPALPRIAHL